MRGEGASGSHYPSAARAPSAPTRAGRHTEAGRRALLPPSESLWLELGEPVEIPGESPDEERHHPRQQNGERPVCNQPDWPWAFDLPERRKRQHCVEKDEQQADLGGPDAAIGNLEDAEHARFEIDVDG